MFPFTAGTYRTCSHSLPGILIGNVYIHCQVQYLQEMLSFTARYIYRTSFNSFPGTYRTMFPFTVWYVEDMFILTAC
jgi:hypothetical protein